jgi:hypothetical protein
MTADGTDATRRLRAPVFFALAIGLLALAGLWFGRYIPRGTLPHPGPGFFPFWLSAILLVLSGLIALDIFRRRAAWEIPGGRSSAARIALVMAVLYGYVLGLDIVGYEIATVALMFGLMLIFGVRLVGAAAMAVAATILSAGLFGYLLRVPLPMKLLTFD